MNSSVAIITARGGSKRIPRKNIKDFLGKPILAYSIDAALDSGCFDEVMVSTDDEEIAEVAKRYGAVIPFYRSVKASDDHATTNEVLLEVFDEYRKRGKTFEVACCLYPTAPFITKEKLRAGFEILRDNDIDATHPITPFSYPILRALKVEDGLLKMIWPEHRNTRSQDLIAAYHDTGQFYWFYVEQFIRNRGQSPRIMPIIVPESEVQDIDNEEDWKIAEMKYRMLLQAGA